MFLPGAHRCCIATPMCRAIHQRDDRDLGAAGVGLGRQMVEGRTHQPDGKRRQFFIHKTAEVPQVSRAAQWIAVVPGAIRRIHQHQISRLRQRCAIDDGRGPAHAMGEIGAQPLLTGLRHGERHLRLVHRAGVQRISDQPDIRLRSHRLRLPGRGMLRGLQFEEGAPKCEANGEIAVGREHKAFHRGRVETQPPRQGNIEHGSRTGRHFRGEFHTAIAADGVDGDGEDSATINQSPFIAPGIPFRRKCVGRRAAGKLARVHLCAVLELDLPEALLAGAQDGTTLSLRLDTEQRTVGGAERHAARLAIQGEDRIVGGPGAERAHRERQHQDEMSHGMVSSLVGESEPRRIAQGNRRKTIFRHVGAPAGLANGRVSRDAGEVWVSASANGDRSAQFVGHRPDHPRQRSHSAAPTAVRF